MNFFKQIFSNVTGYWLHKISSLPIGADLFIDIHKRIGLKKIRVIFDVGANIGQTAKWIRGIEKEARIYCFEPISQPFGQLVHSLRTDSKIVFENIAFGEIVTRKRVAVHEELSVLNSMKEELMNKSLNAKLEDISINTIDNYCTVNSIPEIDLLKIDTEGYELNVLAGAGRMLNSGKIKLIFCEVGFLRENHRNTYFADITEWLSKKGYHFFAIYQLSSISGGTEFGNALFVRADLLKIGDYE